MTNYLYVYDICYVLLIFCEKKKYKFEWNIIHLTWQPSITRTYWKLFKGLTMDLEPFMYIYIILYLKHKIFYQVATLEKQILLEIICLFRWFYKYIPRIVFYNKTLELSNYNLFKMMAHFTQLKIDSGLFQIRVSIPLMSLKRNFFL